MDQTAFYQTLEDLEAVNPDLAKLAGIESSGKWVLLVEACNFAAKEARSTFQQHRDEFRAANPTIKQIPAEIKKWDIMSDNLMKSAKNLLLPEALANGAEAFQSQDDAGKPVILLRHPEAGMVAIHGVNVEKMEDESLRNAIKPADESSVFTGFRRQRLADVLAKAVSGQDGIADLVVQVIKRASLDRPFANAVNAQLENSKNGQEPTKEDVISALLQQNTLG